MSYVPTDARQATRQRESSGLARGRGFARPRPKPVKKFIEKIFSTRAGGPGKNWETVEMAESGDTELAKQRAAEREAEHPRPQFIFPAHPDEPLLDAVIGFAWRVVKWNMEEILDGRTARKNELPQRQAEARVLSELHRTLEKFTRLKKSRTAESQDERTDDDLRAELLEGFRKIVDARGT